MAQASQDFACVLFTSISLLQHRSQRGMERASGSSRWDVANAVTGTFLRGGVRIPSCHVGIEIVELEGRPDCGGQACKKWDEDPVEVGEETIVSGWDGRLKYAPSSPSRPPLPAIFPAFFFGRATLSHCHLRITPLPPSASIPSSILGLACIFTIPPSRRHRWRCRCIPRTKDIIPHCSLPTDAALSVLRSIVSAIRTSHSSYQHGSSSSR